MIKFKEYLSPSQRPLVESQQVGNITSRFRDFCNHSFPIGKVTKNDATNSYSLILDKDNQITLKLIPMLTRDDASCVSIFVDSTYQVLHTVLSSWNYAYIAAAFENVGNLHQFVKTIKSGYVGIDGMMWGYNQYFQRLLINRILEANPSLQIANNKATTLLTIDTGAIKYGLEIDHQTNQIDINVTFVNFYVGDMIITQSNYQKLIDNFATLVKRVNATPDITNINLIRELLVTTT